jgi:hypothetical protein
MVDTGFAAQDVGEVRRRDRGHSAEKGGVVRRSIVATEHLATRRGCRMLGMTAIERFEEHRVLAACERYPSTPDCQRTLIDESKSLPLRVAAACCESWLRLVPRRLARLQRKRLRQDSHPRPGRAADEERAANVPLRAGPGSR